MFDPVTGQYESVQLGSKRRLRTIFNVNMRVAYETGKWERIKRVEKTFPFLRYTAIMDGRERPQHHAWHGTILPVNDLWWDSHTPPCGWNCRCTVLSYNQRQMDRRGLIQTDKPAAFPMKSFTNKRTGEVTQVEDGIDPGWSYHVGKAPLGGLSPAPIEGFKGRDDVATAAQRNKPANLEKLRLAFGLKADGVFTDASGWPLAISAGWLRGLIARTRSTRSTRSMPSLTPPKSGWSGSPATTAAPC